MKAKTYDFLRTLFLIIIIPLIIIVIPYSLSMWLYNTGHNTWGSIALVIYALSIFGVVKHYSSNRNILKYKQNQEIKQMKQISIESLNTIKDIYDKLDKFDSQKLNGAKNDKAGIYALYVSSKHSKINDFVPVYVGKAVNFTNRWKTHYQEIEKAYFGDKEVETKYLKLANFMHRNKIQLSDVKCAVLEQGIRKNMLREREKHYINLLKVNIHGMNAIK